MYSLFLVSLCSHLNPHILNTLQNTVALRQSLSSLNDLKVYLNLVRHFKAFVMTRESDGGRRAKIRADILVLVISSGILVLFLPNCIWTML